MGQQQSLFIDELMDWLRTSKQGPKKTESSTGNNMSNEAKQEIMKLQAMYYEERRKYQEILSKVNRVERRNEELERMAANEYWKFEN